MHSRAWRAGARQALPQLFARHACHLPPARDELGLSDHVVARPIQAALTSALTFTVGASVPLVIALLAPRTYTSFAVSAGSLACLSCLGAVGARIGGASMLRLKFQHRS